MDVWQITVAALRRWYVLLPLLVLTAFGALRVGEGVHPQYEANATTILVPGPAASEFDSPYGGRTDTNQVLSIVLTSAASRESIEAQGLSPDYEVRIRDRSSFLGVTVLADSPEESLETAEAVIELGRQELKQRQDDVGMPTAAQYEIQVLEPPAISEVVEEGKMRNMAIVGILGAALSLLIAVLFDDLMGLLRRALRRRRDRKGAAITETVDAEDPRRDVRTRSATDDGAYVGHGDAIPENAADVTRDDFPTTPDMDAREPTRNHR